MIKVLIITGILAFLAVGIISWLCTNKAIKGFKDIFERWQKWTIYKKYTTTEKRGLK